MYVYGSISIFWYKIKSLNQKRNILSLFALSEANISHTSAKKIIFDEKFDHSDSNLSNYEKKGTRTGRQTFLHIREGDKSEYYYNNFIFLYIIDGQMICISRNSVQSEFTLYEPKCYRNHCRIWSHFAFTLNFDRWKFFEVRAARFSASLLAGDSRVVASLSFSSISSVKSFSEEWTSPKNSSAGTSLNLAFPISLDAEMTYWTRSITWGCSRSLSTECERNWLK